MAYHIPVMVAEVVAGLVADPAGAYVDATVGGGGHSWALLQAPQPRGAAASSRSRPGSRRGSASEVGSRYAKPSCGKARFAELSELHGSGRDRAVERRPVRLRSFPRVRSTRPASGIQLSSRRASRYANGCGSWPNSRRIDRGVQRDRTGRVNCSLRRRTRSAAGRSASIYRQQRLAPLDHYGRLCGRP